MVAVFVILTFVGFIVVDGLVQWAESRKSGAPAKPALPTAPAPALVTRAGSLPGGLFLDKAHTWLSLEAPEDQVRVGVDSFIQGALGRAEQVELPRVGQSVRRGEPLFTLRRGTRKATFPSPLEGEVRSVNPHLRGDPHLLERDPYKEGWVCTLQPRRLGETLKTLLIGEEARARLRREMEHFRDFLAASYSAHPELGRLAPDGGLPLGELFALADDGTWERFLSEFVEESWEAETPEFKAGRTVW